jgi:hypothetical protein
MSEYELVNMISGATSRATSSATPAMGLSFTAISGYLIVARLVVQRLTKSQLVLMDTPFPGFGSLIKFAWIGKHRRGLSCNRLMLPRRTTAILHPSYGFYQRKAHFCVESDLVVV